MNPLFRNPQMLNPMQYMGQAINDIRMLQQNPNQMAKYLSDHGKLSPEQAKQIGQMSPSQIGQYLMQNGMMSQQGAQNAYQNFVPMIKNHLN